MAKDIDKSNKEDSLNSAGKSLKKFFIPTLGLTVEAKDEADALTKAAVQVKSVDNKEEVGDGKL